MQDLRGKVCVVTGGASGIGLAMARRFHDAGMRIVLGDVDADALVAATEILGDGAIGVHCDVTSPSSMDELREAALRQFGSVHLVCLNAGVAPIGLLLETRVDSWRWAIDVNVMGVVHGINSFVPLMVAQGAGHVVCTASTAGVSTTFAMGAYTATKHAVIGIATTLHTEVGAAGVGVTILCPGSFKTQIFDSERNCPSAFDVLPDAAPEQVVSLYKGVVAASPDPSVAAQAVFDAVVSNDLFVFPSPEVNPLIVERLNAIGGALRDPICAEQAVMQ